MVISIGGRVKVVEIPGGMSKFEEKRGFPKGLMRKSKKSQGVILKLTANPGGRLQKN